MASIQHRVRHGVPRRVRRALSPIYQGTIAPSVHQSFYRDLVKKTENFGHVTWLGQPIWQNILDLWTIQETIVEVAPSLLIECGTNRGGSALFFAHLFDLIGNGRVVTIDVEKMHDLVHPRIDFLIGSSVATDTIEQVRAIATGIAGPVMVILDSDHSEGHVGRELDAYAPFVTPGSFLLAQDGVIDTLSSFRAGRPGPLPAIRSFLKRHPEFEADVARSERFLITHHPLGWLRRKGTGA